MVETTYLPEVECVVEIEAGMVDTSVIYVADEEGAKHYLRVARSDPRRAGDKTYLLVGVVHLDYKARRALVELPTEADSGARRVWVPFDCFRPQREEESRVRAALNLVVIRSADLERAARFYAALGVEFVRERHGGGPEHLAARLGPVVFEVYPQGDGPSSLGVRLGFRVGSVAEAVEAARAAGGAVVSEPRPSPWGVRAVVADPDAHRIELLEG
jgi:catechol 2,3-dioxygenase-like lactoylglutathione lyase family enzyme